MNVAIVGSGNVATAFARAIDALPGYRVGQVLGRNVDHARRLARGLKDAAADTIEALSPHTDIAIVAVTDSALPVVAERLPVHPATVYAHTSGTMEACGPINTVIYPFQSFTSSIAVDMRRVPIILSLDGCTPAQAAPMRELASAISESVFTLDASARHRLHVAGVFAGNFTNYMLTLASEVLRDASLPAEMLRPLVEYTVAKAFAIGPEEGQTGPARRGDTGVFAEHLALLDGRKAEIYQLLSNAILNHYHNEQN